MLITRRSNLSGKVRTMDLPITEEQVKAWENGGLIQQVMPHLNASQREFIISGATQEEWDELFGPEDL